MGKWKSIVFMVVAAVILVFFLEKTGLWKTMSPKELQSSMELADIHTMWVSKYYQPWPPRLILVPALSFRVKNISKKPLRYINFNANFRFRDDFENLGDCFLAAIRKDPILPGNTSDPILLKSNYGVEGKNLASFENNPQWKTVIVKLFSQSKGSQYVLLAEWEVSKTIDFKEPEPVGKEKAEETKSNKKEDRASFN